MPARPPLGLLLDVDGPVASPRTRTVAVPGLLEDLSALLGAGIPVVLNTGRSAEFVGKRVLEPLAAVGLPRGARLHAVCEKGAVWLSPGDGGAIHLDAGLAVPDACHRIVEELVAAGHGTAMFVDRSKRTMATAEARTDVPAAEYAHAQRAFAAALLARLTAAGLGVRLGERGVPDADGRTPWRIDPSAIATDVESAAVGKDLGARRALTLLAADGPLPRAWHTVGDSRTDYAMADQLHALGYEVTHVDVGPSGPPPARPYPVRTVPRLSDDAAGAAHLRSVVAALSGG